MFIFVAYLKEEKSRVEIFHTYAKKQKRTIWSWFLGILQRQDNFIVNQVCRLSSRESSLSGGILFLSLAPIFFTKSHSVHEIRLSADIYC